MLGNRTINLIGKKFGRLTVVEFGGYLTKHYGKYAKWKCLCDCGNTVVILASKLKNGDTQSCGCLQRELFSAVNRKEDGHAPFIQLYYNYKSRAKKRKLVFDLSKDEFKVITSGNCRYCGSQPSLEIDTRWSKIPYIYNGIDRINNNIGYVWYNCVPCCSICNSMKSNMTFDAFIDKVKQIHDHIDKE